MTGFESAVQDTKPTSLFPGIGHSGKVSLLVKKQKQNTHTHTHTHTHKHTHTKQNQKTKTKNGVHFQRLETKIYRIY